MPLPVSFPLSGGSRFLQFDSWASGRTSSRSSDSDSGSNSGGGDEEDGDWAAAAARAAQEARELQAVIGAEEGFDDEAAGGEETKDEGANKRRSSSIKAAAAAAKAAGTGGGKLKLWSCGKKTRTRREVAALVVAGTVVGAALGICLALAVYAVLLRVITPPLLTVTQCKLVGLAFRGAAVDAVVAIEGAIQSRCRYGVWIEAPRIDVFYPTIETGVRIGAVQFASLSVPPRERAVQAANASFPDVNHAGAGQPGKEGLGQQLVNEVLANQPSSLGLAAAVHAHAHLRLLPPVPVQLHLRCRFVNHWGQEGPEASVCATKLRPFWSKATAS